MNATNGSIGSGAAESRCHLLAVDREPGKTRGPNTDKEIAGLRGSEESRPLHTEGLFTGNLRRQITFSQLDVGFGPAGDGHRIRVERPAAHQGLAVVRLEPGLAIGGGQHTIRHRVPLGAQELGSGNKRDSGAGKLGMKAVEDGDDMRGLACIVSDQRSCLVGERAYDGNLPDFRLERKQSIVLEQNHGLIGEFSSVRAMFGAVQFLLVDLCVRNHVRRIEHAKLYACSEQARERDVQRALRQVSLLNRVNIGFFNRLAESGSKCDALIVHAAYHGDGRALRLCRTVSMVRGNVPDGVAVRDHVSVEAPLAAQLILQQILVGACRLAIDGVIRAHDGTGLPFHDGGAEGRLVGIHFIVFAHVHIGKVPSGFRPAVHGVVLRCSDCKIVVGIVAL